MVPYTASESHTLASAQAALLDNLGATSGAARSGIKTVLAHLGGDTAVDADAAAAAFNDAFHGADFAEGAAAFLAKRAPSFQ